MTTFAAMRRNDRQLTLKDAWPILIEAEYGLLATIGLNGYPYAIPLSFVVFVDKIYFHCALDVGAKLDNIKAYPKVCFTVVGKTQVLPEKFSTNYDSVIVFGQARRANDECKQKALEGLVKKYAKECEESGAKYIKAAFKTTDVYEIEIEHMTGKSRR